MFGLVPSHIQSSSGVVDTTGAFTASLAGVTIGSLIIVQLIYDGTGGLINIDTATTSGVERLDGTDNDMTVIPGPGTSSNSDGWPVGNPTAAYQKLWIGRATATTVTFGGSNNSGDDVYVLIHEFSDVNAGTTLADVIENSTAGNAVNEAGTSTSVPDTNIVTLGVDRLALNFIAINDDATGIGEYTGESGGAWRMLKQYETATGTDATLALNGAYPGVVGIEIGQSSVADIFGGTGTNEMQAQSFSSGAGGTIDKVIMYISKNNSPVDDVIVEIQTDSGGLPSGTVVGTGAQVSGASLPAVGSGSLASFDVSATLSASTIYYLVVRRSGSRDTTNFYTLRGLNPGTYADGANYQRQSGTWSQTGSGDTLFALQQNAGHTIGGGSRTITSDGWGVIGFALIGTAAAIPGMPQIYRPKSRLALSRRRM